MEQVTQHHMTAQLTHDKYGPGLMICQQDGLAEEQSIYIHPAQMRLVCEQLGIIAPDANAARTIATLQRRMTGLRDRIDALEQWLTNHSDHEHADLSREVTQVQALADLAGEWCADFEEAPTDSVQAETKAEPASITTPSLF